MTNFLFRRFVIESLQYEFRTDKAGDYDLRLRVAANKGGKEIKVILYPPNGSPFSRILRVPSGGWDDFNDIFWNDIRLVNGHYKAQVYFITGQTSKYTAEHGFVK